MKSQRQRTAFTNVSADCVERTVQARAHRRGWAPGRQLVLSRTPLAQLMCYDGKATG